MTNPSFTGGYAEYALASKESIAIKPASLRFVEAASAPVVAVTAWQMLFDRAKVERGQRVLVQGAAGNVGAYVVALARWAGVRVIGVADGRDAAYLRELGAEKTIDYHTALRRRGRRCRRRHRYRRRRDAGRSSPSSATGAPRLERLPPPPELAQQYGVRGDYFIVEVNRPQLERIAQLFDEGALKADVGVVLCPRMREVHEMLAGKVPQRAGRSCSPSRAETPVQRGLRKVLRIGLLGALVRAVAVFAAPPRAEGQRLQVRLYPLAREIRVVSRARLARLAARNRDPAAIPIADVPDRAEALREARLLQVNRVLVAFARQPGAVEEGEVHRRERMLDAHAAGVSPRRGARETQRSASPDIVEARGRPDRRAARPAARLTRNLIEHRRVESRAPAPPRANSARSGRPTARASPEPSSLVQRVRPRAIARRRARSPARSARACRVAFARNTRRRNVAARCSSSAMR